MKSRLLLLPAFLMVLSLSACGSLNSTLSDHASSDGEFGELYIPADVFITFSASTMHPEQNALMLDFQEDMPELEVLQEEFLGFLREDPEFPEAEFSQLMSFLDQPYRMVFGVSFMDEEVYGAITAEDMSEFEALIQTVFPEAEAQTIAGAQAYVVDDELYIALKDSFALAAGSPESLTEMLELKASDSLWKRDEYKEAMEGVGSNYLLSFVEFPADLQEEFEEVFAEDLDESFDGLAPSTILDMVGAVDYEAFTLRFVEDGLLMDSYAQYNDEASEDMVALYKVLHEGHSYMYESTPSEGLMAMGEMYGLKQIVDHVVSMFELTQQELDQMDAMVQLALGMDLFDDILGFMDQGAAFAVYDNQNVIPGLAVVFDASSDREAAERFVDSLATTVEGFSAMAAQELPGVLSFETVDMHGGSFRKLSFNVDALPEEAKAEMPEFLAGSMELVLGVTGDGHLVLSNAKVWTEGHSELLPDSALYQGLSSYLGSEYDYGLFMMDGQRSVDYFMNQLKPLVVEELMELERVEFERVFGLIEPVFSRVEGVIGAAEYEGYMIHGQAYLIFE